MKANTGMPVAADGGGGVVLRRVDVAGGPADVGAERFQRLDQHCGLDGHVQRARDARGLQRLLCGVFLAHRHEARHLGLGDVDFLAAPGGEANVLDVVVHAVSAAFPPDKDIKNSLYLAWGAESQDAFRAASATLSFPRHCRA